MQGEDIIRISLEQYATQLDFLVSAGTCHPPSIEEGYVTKVRYQFVDVDLGLELSLEVRDVVVDSFIVLLPDAVQPDVAVFRSKQTCAFVSCECLRKFDRVLAELVVRIDTVEIGY